MRSPDASHRSAGTQGLLKLSGEAQLDDAVLLLAAGRAVGMGARILRAGPGAFMAITGPSGSGKTSLLQMIGSLDRPTPGTMSLRVPRSGARRIARGQPSADPAEA